MRNIRILTKSNLFCVIWKIETEFYGKTINSGNLLSIEIMLRGKRYNFNRTMLHLRSNVGTCYRLLTVVIVDKVHWIFVVRADKIKSLFTPKV
jgi:hypothetical protein